jgi:hypothetical protein
MIRCLSLWNPGALLMLVSCCHASLVISHVTANNALLCLDFAIVLHGDLVVALEGGDGVVGDLGTAAVSTCKCR